MKKLKFILRYFKYRLKAKSALKIHSPFIYDLVTEVFQDKLHYKEYDIIDKFRSKLLRDHSVMEVIDFGAGSKGKHYSTYYSTVHKIAKRTSQPKKFSNLLFRLVKHFRPGNIVELGTSFGLSTISIALANPESKFTTIEGCSAVVAKAKDNFDSLMLDNINILIGNFDHILPEYFRTIDNIDLVFFDGNHKKEKTLEYFNICLPYVNNNTIFVFDDIHWSTGMEEAWQIIKEHEEVKVSIDLFFMGLVFFRKELSKQDFIIRF